MSNVDGLSRVEMVLAIEVFGAFVIIMLPSIQDVLDASQRASCANNLRQIGLSLSMYSAESKEGKYPRLGYYYTPESDCALYEDLGASMLPIPILTFLFHLSDVYPEYVQDTALLVCPSDPDVGHSTSNNGVAMGSIANSVCSRDGRGWSLSLGSYVYFGHVLDKMGDDHPRDAYSYLGYLGHYCTDDARSGLGSLSVQFAAWFGYLASGVNRDPLEFLCDVDHDWTIRDAHRVGFETAPYGALLGNGDGNDIRRLRDGIERFLITDFNGTEASSEALSRVFVLWDRTSSHPNRFSHAPAGSNVLYLDGHVEFVGYPSHDQPPLNLASVQAWECLQTGI